MRLVRYAELREQVERLTAAFGQQSLENQVEAYKQSLVSGYETQGFDATAALTKATEQAELAKSAFLSEERANAAEGRATAAETQAGTAATQVYAARYADKYGVPEDVRPRLLQTASPGEMESLAQDLGELAT
ncbi:MAG: hypothetical protein IIB19_07955, partial [Chloroflexi bacterium]|nr:hypothetical protein [Chloroflexota bacterium]